MCIVNTALNGFRSVMRTWNIVFEEIVLKVSFLEAESERTKQNQLSHLRAFWMMHEPVSECISFVFEETSYTVK